MKIKALVSFAGAVSMAEGEIRDVADERLAASLIACRYAERVNENEVERSDNRRRKKASENRQ